MPSKRKNKRSKACEFSKDTKLVMMIRDDYKCIFCGGLNITPAHYIARSHGGLGILQNGACICQHHHDLIDGKLGKNYKQQAEEYKEKFKKYLQSHYKDWDEKKLIYRKWKNE